MNITEPTMEYIDHHGSDLLVVNAARASFGKEVAWLPSGAPNDYEGVVYQNIDGHPVNLSKGDANLIRFLATGYRTHEWEEFLQQVRNVAANGTLQELTALLHEYKRKAQHWAPFGHPHLDAANDPADFPGSAIRQASSRRRLVRRVPALHCRRA